MATSHFVALQHRNFRLLWLGQLISFAGSMMQTAAILWHVSLLVPPDQRGLALGFVGLVRVGPVIVFSLVSGVAADALDRRRLMLFTQTVSALIAGVLGLLTLLGLTEVWPIYVLAAMSSAVGAFDLPARQALIPALVPREHLPNAISLNQIMFQASVVGPSVGGLVIAMLGVGWTYFFNALSFLCVLLALALMRGVPPVGDGERSDVSLRAALEGLRFVFSTPIIRSTMLLDFFATFFASATALLPIFAQDILQVGAQGYGWLYAAPAAGSLIASAAMVRVVDRIDRRGLVLLWSIVAYGLATIVFGLSRSFWLTFMCLALLATAWMAAAVPALVRYRREIVVRSPWSGVHNGPRTTDNGQQSVTIPATRPMIDPNLALVLSGGGARAAYQVGVLRHLASRYPDLAPGVLTGVSAGGIIAMHLASRRGSFAAAVTELSELWTGLRMSDVFRVDPASLGSRVTRWGLRLVSGGVRAAPRARSFVDTRPLRDFLSRTFHAGPDGLLDGIAPNLEAQSLRAVALTAASYTTGQSVTWVQRANECGIGDWQRPQRKGVSCRLSVDHVMASAALPFVFPAVEIDGAWYGDGGMRLTAPLSPAVHLGARKILAVSTRYARSREEADVPAVSGYPPPAVVAGVLYNTIFLDLLDHDALRLQQLNALLAKLPPESRDGLVQIDLLVLRPSQDLGRLANAFEADLPRSFRFLMRGLGSRETRSNDMLSLLMFQRDYVTQLIDLGEADARARSAEIDAFLRLDASTAAASHA